MFGGGGNGQAAGVELARYHNLFRGHGSTVTCGLKLIDDPHHALARDAEVGSDSHSRVALAVSVSDLGAVICREAVAKVPLLGWWSRFVVRSLRSNGTATQLVEGRVVPGIPGDEPHQVK